MIGWWAWLVVLGLTVGLQLGLGLSAGLQLGALSSVLLQRFWGFAKARRLDVIDAQRIVIFEHLNLL